MAAARNAAKKMVENSKKEKEKSKRDSMRESKGKGTKKMSKEQVEKMLAEKPTKSSSFNTKQQTPPQQSSTPSKSKSSITDVLKQLKKEKPPIAKQASNDETQLPVMVKNAQNYMPPSNRNPVNRSHSDVMRKAYQPHSQWGRRHKSDITTPSNERGSRNNSMRFNADSDHEYRSRNGSFHNRSDYYDDDRLSYTSHREYYDRNYHSPKGYNNDFEEFAERRHRVMNTRQAPVPKNENKIRKLYSQQDRQQQQSERQQINRRKQQCKQNPILNPLTKSSSSFTNRLSHQRMTDSHTKSLETSEISDGELVLERSEEFPRKKNPNSELNTSKKIRKDTSALTPKKSRSTDDVLTDMHMKSPIEKPLQNGKMTREIVRNAQSQKKIVPLTNERSSQTFVNANVFNLSPRHSRDGIGGDTSNESEKRFLHLSTPTIQATLERNMQQSGASSPNIVYMLRKLFSNHLLRAADSAALLMSEVNSPAEKRVGLQNLNVLRGLVRENNESVQEQLLDTSSIAPPSAATLTTSKNDILDKIKTPFQTQILERRIQTLDADREVLRQLNKSLAEENESLKAVHLSRSNLDLKESTTFQSSLKSANPEDKSASPSNGHTFSREIGELKKLVTHLNEDLLREKERNIGSREALFDSYLPSRSEGALMHDHWDQLREQSKLVLEENQLLVDQKALYKKTINDLTQDYQKEVTRLSSQLSESNKEKKNLEHLLSERVLELSLLREKFERVAEQNESRIDISEHDTKVERLHRNYMNEINTLKSEREKVNSSLEASNKEKTRLAVQVTDLTATNSRLLLELKLAEKNVRKSERRIAECMSELEDVYGKEVATKGTLNQVLKLAEKTSKEKDQMALLVEVQKERTQEALDQIQHDDLKLNELRKQLKMTKDRRKNQFSKIKQRILDQDEEVSTIIGKYENELTELQDVVRQKQHFINQIQADKVATEKRLNDMYRSIKKSSDKYI